MDKSLPFLGGGSMFLISLPFGLVTGAGAGTGAAGAAGAGAAGAGAAGAGARPPSNRCCIKASDFPPAALLLPSDDGGFDDDMTCFFKF